MGKRTVIEMPSYTTKKIFDFETINFFFSFNYPDQPKLFKNVEFGIDMESRVAIGTKLKRIFKVT